MKQGIYKMSKEEYLADPCEIPSLSRGTLKDMIFNCPATARYNHPRLNPDKKEETSDRFDIGTTNHSLLLEKKDQVVVLDADNWRTKAVKEERDKLRAKGKTVLLKPQYEASLSMVEAARKQIPESELRIKDLQKEGKAENTYIWEEDGTMFRARLDWISKDNSIIIDYKTTSASANPNNFASIIISTGLDIQCALYKRAVEVLTGVHARFVLIVQETFEPYLCSFISLSPEFEQMGKDKVMYGTYLWRQCMETKKWDGYPNRIAYIDPPAWSLAQFESIAERIGE